MCDSGSLEMFEIDSSKGVILSTTKGCRNIILRVHLDLGFFVDVNDQKFVIWHGFVFSGCSGWLLYL